MIPRMMLARYSQPVAALPFVGTIRQDRLLFRERLWWIGHAVFFSPANKPLQKPVDGARGDRGSEQQVQMVAALTIGISQERMKSGLAEIGIPPLSRRPV